MQRPFKLILSGRTKRSPLPHATENATENSKLVTHCPLHETARQFMKAIVWSHAKKKHHLCDLHPQANNVVPREEVRRSTRKCNVPGTYVKLIHDIELRLRNQDAQVAGGESSRFNVDVRLHQRSALSQSLFLVTDGVTKQLPESMMFALDIVGVLCEGSEVNMTDYMDTWKQLLEEKEG